MKDSLEKPRLSDWVHELFRVPRPLEKETGLFIMASALDLFMTYLLLVYSGGPDGEVTFYESNPLARYFYDRWDHYGLVCFKFGIVAFVAVNAQIIAAKRPRAAQLLLNFATVLVACVVIYSFSLLVRNAPLF